MARILQGTAIGLTSLLLLLVGIFLWLESSWVEEQELTGEETFLHGSIGAEIMPLPVFQVLSDLFPDQFQPGGPAAGDWMEQFGFIRSAATGYDNLPLGFEAANYRPKSGAPSPVKFVGFSCALCHSQLIRRSGNDEGVLIYGMGNPNLDLFAWVDGLLTALLDEERLSAATVADAYEAKYGRSLSMSEKLMIRFWLSSARPLLAEALTRFDDPYSGADLRNADVMLNGPGRTQPFRELVRFVLNRPGATDRAFTKLPAVYRQADREWAQVDGSVRDPLSRSVLAALAAGSTLDNLLIPGITANVLKANAYIETLNGPRYADVFPDLPIDMARARRGRAVYEQYCFSCHGDRDPETGTWISGPRLGEIVEVSELGTDTERLTFRHYDNIVEDLYNHFPDKHPMRPNRDNLRTGTGYINAPIEAAFTRFPFLHNGSVPTMAELINLKPRRAVFYRGANLYDPQDMGLIAPDSPDDRHYYRFDRNKRGNGNQGHDYPWTFRGPGWNEAALLDLLEYLKTL